MRKLVDSRKFFAAVFVILLCLFCLRVTGLDKDLPPYGLGAYNPTDEGVYTSMGLNLYNYGSAEPEVQVSGGHVVTPYTAYHIRNNVIENMLVYAGLSVFGDNYFGFRFPMVLISLVNLILILQITWSIVSKYGDINKQKWIVLLAEALYTFSFPYLVSSRVVEPTLLRMTFGLLAFLLFIRIKNRTWRYFSSGLVITLSLQLVYITNVFFYIAILAAGCVEAIREKGKVFFRCAFSCIAGCITAVLLAAGYYAIVWKTNFISNALSIFGDFSGVAGYTSVGGDGIKSVVGYFLDFFGSNTFIFHLPLLFVFLMLLPAVIQVVIRKKDEILTFSLFSVFGLLLQTLYTNDYIFRKAFIILPFAASCICIWILRYRDITPFREEKHYKIRNLYLAIISLFVLLLLWYRFFTNRAGTSGDFPAGLKAGLIIEAVICIICITISTFGKKLTARNRTMAVMLTVVISFAINSGCSLQYVWMNQSYSEKEAMISLSKYNNKPVFGAYSYGFSLYNDIQPVLLRNKEQNALVKEIKDDFIFLDVSTECGDYVRGYLNDDMFKGSRYTGVAFETVPRLWRLNGNRMTFAIYGIELKENVILSSRLADAEKADEKKRDTDHLEALSQAAMKVYDIRKKYDGKQNNDSISQQYRDMMEQNREIDQLLSEYRLSDSEVDRLSKEKDAEKISMFNRNTAETVYTTVYGDIRGNVLYPIYGDVYGNIYGDVNAYIHGDVYGDIYGDVNAEIHGIVTGTVYSAKPE